MHSSRDAVLPAVQVLLKLFGGTEVLLDKGIRRCLQVPLAAMQQPLL